MSLRIILGLLILCGSLILMFGKFFFVILGVVLVLLFILWLIRLIADFYWNGKNKGNW